MEGIKCSDCGKEIRTGEHVYPGLWDVWHVDCGHGSAYAVMGSDGKLRWAGNTMTPNYIGEEVSEQLKYTSNISGVG